MNAPPAVGYRPPQEARVLHAIFVDSYALKPQVCGSLQSLPPDDTSFLS